MIGIAEDYACVDVNGISLYYGYEETNESGEWCFVVRNTKSTLIDNILIKIPSSNLEHTNTCEEALLCGIEKAIIRGVINITEVKR